MECLGCDGCGDASFDQIMVRAMTEWLIPLPDRDNN